MARKILDDVLTFAEIGLETPIYDWQAKILGAIDKFALSDRIKIAVSAPNGAGKSERVVGVAILRWLNRFPRGRVILTSADAKQIDFQIMPAVKNTPAASRPGSFWAGPFVLMTTVSSFLSLPMSLVEQRVITRTLIAPY